VDRSDQRGRGINTSRRLSQSQRAAYAAALREGTYLYRTIFERTSVGQLVIDVPSFRIDVVNRAFCSMVGFSLDDLVGSDMARVFPPGLSPADDIVERLNDGAIEGFVAQRPLQRKDGTIFPALVTSAVVRDDAGRPTQLLDNVQDLTRQRASDDVQHRSQAFIDGAIAALPMTFTAFDADLRFTYVAGGLSRSGTIPEDLLGRHVSEFTTHRPTLVALRDALRGVESTTRTQVNGQTYLSLHGPIRNDATTVIGVISVSTNVSAEVSAEAARGQAEELRLFIAQHDPLTGLPGRSALVEHLNALASTKKGPGALLLINLDEFKLINEGMGHTAGDAVLLEVASRLSKAFPGEMISRNGGDEFAVVLASESVPADATVAAERIRTALGADMEMDGRLLRVTAGVGVAIKQTRGPSSTLIGRADWALSRAKDAGVDQCRVYDRDMRLQAETRLVIQGGLRVALAAGQLSVAYQPIVNLSRRRTVGSEALLRWTHPVRGAISPADFIPIAEQSGLIIQIGQWVMSTACGDARTLERDHGIQLSVNISVRQLMGGAFAEWLEGVLMQTTLPPTALTVEVTETALMDDVLQVRQAFQRLRTIGVKVALDDFGTGYSSLARLSSVPVDVIKLDRAFVTGIDKRIEARRMASAILGLSSALGATMVAEGVEIEAEAAILMELGYMYGQGFLFARPMSIDDLTARVGLETTNEPAATRPQKP
jgi:diguanylate cyclase (GGDEF)-like protein/PAS domain S-box-containing protein